jgi:hypothetical protein
VAVILRLGMPPALTWAKLSPEISVQEPELLPLLPRLVALDGSDMFLTVGTAPHVRVKGASRPLPLPELNMLGAIRNGATARPCSRP